MDLRRAGNDGTQEPDPDSPPTSGLIPITSLPLSPSLARVATGFTDGPFGRGNGFNNAQVSDDYGPLAAALAARTPLSRWSGSEVLSDMVNRNINQGIADDAASGSQETARSSGFRYQLQLDSIRPSEDLFAINTQAAPFVLPTPTPDLGSDLSPNLSVPRRSSYLSLPGWVAPTDSPEPPNGTAHSHSSGVRFSLPTPEVVQRPISAAGVLAARRRLTMRQSGIQRLRAADSTDMSNIGLASRSATAQSVGPPMGLIARSITGPPVSLAARNNSQPGSVPRPLTGRQQSSGLLDVITSPSLGPLETIEVARESRSSTPNQPDNRSTPVANFRATGNKKPRPSMLVMLTPWKKRVMNFMNHIYFTWLLVGLTFFIIFEDDFKKACLPPAADLPLETTITVVFVLFTLEMVISSLLRPGYFLGFYFWLDAIGTCSLVFEVPTVRIKFFGGSKYINLADVGGFMDNAGDQLYNSSKAGRVARIFRLLRMLRLYYMYQQHVRRRRIRQALEEGGYSGNNAEQLSMLEFELQQEQEHKTKVGQKLEELTTRRIIWGVLIMMLLIPAFDIRLGTWGRPRRVGVGGLRMLHEMAVLGNENNDLFEAAVQTFSDELIFNTGSHPTGDLFYLTIANMTRIPLSEEPRRFEELYYMSYVTFKCANGTTYDGEAPNDIPDIVAANGSEDCLKFITFAVYDLRWYAQVSAILNIARSLFVIVLLVSGAYFLNRDSRNLVLLPIERMVQRVQELSENPLAMAESRLQLQAPWQDKLQNLQETNVVRNNANRESLAVQWPSLAAIGDRTSERLPTPALLARSSGGGGGMASTTRPTGPDGGGGSGSKPSTAGSSRYPQPHVTFAPLPAESGSGTADGTTEPSFALATTSGAGGGGGGGGWGVLTSSREGGRQSVGFSDKGAMRGSVVTLRCSPRASEAAYWKGTWIGLLLYRLRTHYLRAKTYAKKFAQLMITYLWDGPPDEDSVSDPATGTSGRGVAGAYETEILENSIAKIGALLAIGFGDAGAEIIAENIRNDGDINPMVPGRKTCAVFGFCDIRRFTDTTEVLQEDVMEFVNSIAHIVHTSVSAHGGSPNKNIGDAFLLVWKFPRGVCMQDIHTITRDGRSSSVVRGGLDTPTGLSTANTTTAGGGATPPANTPAAVTPAAVTANTTLRSTQPGAATLSPHPTDITTLPNGSDGTSLSTLPHANSHRSLSAIGPSLVSRISTRRRLLHFPSSVDRSNRILPSDLLGPLMAPPVGNLKLSATLAHNFSLLQMTDEGGAIPADCPCRMMPQPHKLTVIKALLSLKREVDLSKEAKREVIGAIADNALASFVLIQVALKRSARLKRYEMRTDLNRRMPGFQIAMGFGLHVGWAIEGAIGSEYKIDASYLSPNVNMASRLEAATKQFGVPLLLSEDFVECLSATCRQIDCVTVKGSTQPMGLYTYDVCTDGIPEPTEEQVEEGDDSHVEEMLWRSYSCTNEWLENPDLADSWGVDDDFKEEFDRGFFAYRVGNWPEAHRYLEHCRTCRRDSSGLPRVDGPSDVLLRYMAEYDYTAPPGWRGYRELTEK